MNSRITWSRKRKTKDPCDICRLHKQLCICSAIPKLQFKTQVVLIIHAKELKRTTNTGTLAMHALMNSKMYVRGASENRLDLSELVQDDYESLLLYPSAGAELLTPSPDGRPVRLIVPDGNWRQASKVAIRHPELKALRRVTLPFRGLQTTLRREHVENGMATLEAIARAISVLEGEEAGQTLMSLYHAKLAATLAGRNGGNYELSQRIASDYSTAVPDASTGTTRSLFSSSN